MMQVTSSGRHWEVAWNVLTRERRLRWNMRIASTRQNTVKSLFFEVLSNKG